jgi:hypothetical protein
MGPLDGGFLGVGIPGGLWVTCGWTEHDSDFVSMPFGLPIALRDLQWRPMSLEKERCEVRDVNWRVPCV